MGDLRISLIRQVIRFSILRREHIRREKVTRRKWRLQRQDEKLRNGRGGSLWRRCLKIFMMTTMSQVRTRITTLIIGPGDRTRFSVLTANTRPTESIIDEYEHRDDHSIRNRDAEIAEIKAQLDTILDHVLPPTTPSNNSSNQPLKTVWAEKAIFSLKSPSSQKTHNAPSNN